MGVLAKNVFWSMEHGVWRHFFSAAFSRTISVSERIEQLCGLENVTCGTNIWARVKFKFWLSHPSKPSL